MAQPKNQSNRTSPPIPKALRFASGGLGRRGAFSGHIFQEDVYAGIFPYRARLEGKKSICLTGEMGECDKASILCASFGRGHAHSPERSIEDAVEDIAMRLAHYGSALFEILRGSKDSPATLSAFNPKYVWSLPMFLVQVAPRTSWGYLVKKYALLRKSDVWRVKMPAKLGSARKYRAILGQLSTWPEIGPSFLETELENRQFPQDFVFSDYNRMLRISQYRVTRTWGWTMRDWSLEYVTEYYQFHRTLTFMWAQAVLREHIVSELNALLSQLNIAATIALQGVPSAHDILGIREKMKQGTFGFSEVNKALGLNTG